MRHIRSNVERTILHDKWNDKEIEFNGIEIHNNLNDDGGIWTDKINHIVLTDCGHFAEPVGLCSCCSSVLCSACMLICASCHRPIGKCHAKQKDGAWVCAECRAAQKRKSLLRLLLSPIIRFKGKNDENSEQ